ncbi:MAG: 2-oxo acid dehydrogenase subunit E2 [Steroidobacteraceae bacterium]
MVSPPRTGAAGAPVASAAATAPGARLVPHTAMRRRIAEHMARSVATAPHVTAVFEADLSAIIAHRAAHQEAFAARGAKLTLTAYFVAASARALQAVPQVNATFHADALELHPHCNIGVGTALGNEGLIVPVIPRAETLGLFGIAERLTALTAAARANRLAPEDVRGGTFTISNHGVSGSLVAAPVIINQPQVAILGVGKTEKRVVVHEIDGQDAILVRPMCYVSLTIDHRALDGFQTNTFLSKLVETLETWPASAQ